MIYDNLTNGLVEIAIENDICDYNLAEPFIKILLILVDNYRWEKMFISIIKKIELMGKYDFNSILQSDNSNPITLKNYFNLLDLLREFIPKYLTAIKNNLKMSFASNKINTDESQLFLDEETYDILHKFYNNFAEKIKSKGKDYILSYEEDVEISKDIHIYLMRFKVISKELNMITYSSGKNIYNII
jgi:hypothetical protein